jgi:hypothetical protein
VVLSKDGGRQLEAHEFERGLPAHNSTL